MRRLGYVEGGNLSVSRWSAIGVAESQYDEFARRIVTTRPDLIISNTSRLVLAFKAATTTIPIVMMTAGDPVAWGAVDQLSRPGGNITGFAADAGSEETGKRLQFLVECAPAVRTIAYLGTPQTWAGPLAAGLREKAQQIGLPVSPFIVEGQDAGRSVRRALASIPEPNRTGVVTAQTFLSERNDVAEAALALRLPVIGYWVELARAGCLMSYQPQLDVAHRNAAGYVDRILKGANPGDLPVQLPTNFDFVINLKTARTLGLTVPERLLVFTESTRREQWCCASGCGGAKCSSSSPGCRAV